jgi:hypothetical protein
MNNSVLSVTLDNDPYYGQDRGAEVVTATARFPGLGADKPDQYVDIVARGDRAKEQLLGHGAGTTLTIEGSIRLDSGREGSGDYICFEVARSTACTFGQGGSAPRSTAPASSVSRPAPRQAQPIPAPPPPAPKPPAGSLEDIPF